MFARPTQFIDIGTIPYMALLLALLFLVGPLAELAVIVQVAGTIGVLNTVGLLLLVSIVGGWLAKREGVAALRRIQAALARGEIPDRDVADGALILLAGALMIAPGFISDVVALLLLIPPTRAVVRRMLIRRLAERGRARVTVVGSGRGPGGRGPAEPAADDVWDVDSWEDPPRPTASGELRGPT